MADAAKAAAANEAMNGYLGLTIHAPVIDVTPASDAAAAKPSEEPAKDTVTPPQGEQPKVEAGSDVSSATPEQIVYPAWVPEGSKGAFGSLSKEAREAAFKAIEDRRVSIEADATRKWTEAAEIKKDAAKWQSLISDPVKGPKVLAALEAAQEPAVNPHRQTLVDVIGEEAVVAMEAMQEEKTSTVAKQLIHERVDAPIEHQTHTNQAAMDLRQRLGNRVTDAEFEQARQIVGVANGWTAETPDEPYLHLNPENVSRQLIIALNAMRSNKAAAQVPAASPPKPQAAKPASVRSNGNAIPSRPPTPWEAENRAPTSLERGRAAIAKEGLTAARWAEILAHPNG